MALLGFGVDATHGHERTHLDGLRGLAQLVSLYLQSDLVFPEWDAEPRGRAGRLPVAGGAAGERGRPARGPDRHRPVTSAVVLPHVTALRYVVPLREGGSLPGLMEADDEGTYVVKFSGAGQGIKTLAAEVISGGLARRLRLPVPDLVTVDVDPVLAVGEPDQEVQELLRASAGLNLGIDYLPGALDFEASATDVEPGLAGRVLWFDALVGNVDRSWRNPNMLCWHGRLQLIDHGATLTFQHAWSGVEGWAVRPYDASAHALLECGPDLLAADASLAR